MFSYFGPPFVGGAVAIALVALTALTLTGCRDPGTVTASEPPVDAGGRENRYCDRCRLFQPTGAMHCDDCDVCIEQLDHHCPWMGRCVGRRNLCAFRIFNLSWLSYFAYMIGCTMFLAGKDQP